MPDIQLKNRGLVARIGDNGQRGNHRAGYNGVWSLTSGRDRSNLFVSRFAGLNFEHIFDGHVWDHDPLFEPRLAPMTLRRTAEDEAELYQPPTPFWGLESWTRFKLVGPHFIDMTFRCVPRKPVYKHGYIGLFWASYINAPENKSLYFWGRKDKAESLRWMQLCTQHHNDQSTVVHESQTEPELKVAKPPGPRLFISYSKLRYTEPLMFGRWKDKVLAVMFDRVNGIRLAHSPSGAGPTPDKRDTNPAWDWQLIIPNYKLNREYGYRARVAFKKYAGREELRAMWRKWRAQ